MTTNFMTHTVVMNSGRVDFKIERGSESTVDMNLIANSVMSHDGVLVNNRNIAPVNIKLSLEEAGRILSFFYARDDNSIQIKRSTKSIAINMNNKGQFGIVASQQQRTIAAVYLSNYDLLSLKIYLAHYIGAALCVPSNTILEEIRIQSLAKFS